MNRKMTTAAKIRRMLAKGYEPKEIAHKLDCRVQQVYTVRYHENKKLGVGSLVTTTPKPIPVVGVATPKKRGRPRKAETPTPQQDSSSREEWPAFATPVVIPTKPTLVQRVKGWFASWR